MDITKINLHLSINFLIFAPNINSNDMKNIKNWLEGVIGRSLISLQITNDKMRLKYLKEIKAQGKALTLEEQKEINYLEWKMHWY